MNIRTHNEKLLQKTFPVPPEIDQAALKVETWFKQHGYSHWKYRGLESRDYPSSKAASDGQSAEEALGDVAIKVHIQTPTGG